jgi:DNA-binding PucR family transcriptional regulator
MRASLVLLPLCLCAAPALAQSAPPPAPHPDQAPPRLADPAAAGRLADAVQSLSDALLDLKVGGMQAALEARKPTPAERNRTVRDLARRDDPQIERHLDERIAEAKPVIEQGIRAMNEAMPEIARSLAEARKSLERAIANMPDPNYPRR